MPLTRLHIVPSGGGSGKDADVQGGVTSSSLEVLAGLGLTDAEYIDLMMFKEGKPSSFCESYGGRGAGLKHKTKATFEISSKRSARTRRRSTPGTLLDNHLCVRTLTHLPAVLSACGGRIMQFEPAC